MAHMMLFYELMRVKREYNAETRNQLAITQKMNRMQKQIDRTTKYYNSLFTQLENQAKCMQNNANVYFQSLTGGFNFNCNDYSGMSGLAQFIPQVFAKGDFTYGKDDKGEAITISSDRYKELQDIAATNNGSLKVYNNEAGKYDLVQGVNSENEIRAFAAVQNAATQIQNNMKMAVTQMTNMFQNGVTSWLECQKSALTAEQDQTLDALNYEETMLECDQTASKTRCEELKAEKESLQQELSERVKEDAPGFGL